MRATLPSVVLVLALSPLGAACTEPRDASGPALRVFWAAATGPRAGLPPDVESLTIRVLDPEADPAERTLEIGRDELTDDTPFAVVGGLPAARPFEVRIAATVGGRTAYTGVVGPLVLGPGERRYVDLLLVPTDAVTEIAHLGVPLAMPTATTLADGRILFAGGFTATAEVACADQPAGSRCFDLTATRTAVLYDPASGQALTARNSMSAPRAAHTATRLADGRVLLAGGASAAQLALVAQPDGALLPVLRIADGAVQATTDVFDPTSFREDDDVGADGDPGRGGFEDGPPMTTARAQHTATLLPAGDAVLVAGGSGAEQTSELWNGETWADAGALGVARRGHVAVALRDTPAVWLLAGAIGADAESDLADVFAVGADGRSGTWALPPDLELPAGGAEAAAGLNLSGAGAALLGDRTALVVGWPGPVCDAGGEPAFTGTACPPDNRAFALDLRAARAAQPVGPAGVLHGMGAVVAAPDGSAYAIGGFVDPVPTVSGRIDRFTGAVDEATVQPTVDAAFAHELVRGRALVGAAAQTDGAVVVAGGLTVDVRGAVLSDLVELVNPAR